MLARSHGEARRLGPHSFDKDNGSEMAFRFILDRLVDEAGNCLESTTETITALTELAEAMGTDPPREPLHTAIPAAFTYFGQFIDHDITTGAPPFRGAQDPIGLLKIQPLKRAQAEQLRTNARGSPLELGCLYDSPAVRDQDGCMKLGEVTPADRHLGPINTEDRLHDVPRRPKIPDPRTNEQKARDREALVGDPRNDENVIVSQLHVAFLRTHNKLVERYKNPAKAREELLRRYQWAVLNDFLDRICDPGIACDVRVKGPRFVNMDGPKGAYMPLEFTGAAYRYGHSMIRDAYNYNKSINEDMFSSTLTSMFTFTALSGNIGPHGDSGSDTLPDNWIIDWPRFFEGDEGGGLNPARRIDTKLERQLAELTDTLGQPMPAPMGRLATRNLLRGYWLGLPTGQAVARFMGIEAMTEAALLAAAPDSVRHRFEQNNFHKTTPLWFYILAEAGNPAGPNGQHLGKVGSRIVAETLWNFVKHSRGSVLESPPTQTEIESGEFSLRGIISIGQDPKLEQLGYGGPKRSDGKTLGGRANE
jgi:hypothetical protein